MEHTINEYGEKIEPEVETIISDLLAKQKEGSLGFKISTVLQDLERKGIKKYTIDEAVTSDTKLILEKRYRAVLISYLDHLLRNEEHYGNIGENSRIVSFLVKYFLNADENIVSQLRNSFLTVGEKKRLAVAIGVPVALVIGGLALGVPLSEYVEYIEETQKRVEKLPDTETKKESDPQG